MVKYRPNKETPLSRHTKFIPDIEYLSCTALFTHTYYIGHNKMVQQFNMYSTKPHWKANYTTPSVYLKDQWKNISLLWPAECGDFWQQAQPYTTYTLIHMYTTYLLHVQVRVFMLLYLVCTTGCSVQHQTESCHKLTSAGSSSLATSYNYTSSQLITTPLCPWSLQCVHCSRAYSCPWDHHW